MNKYIPQRMSVCHDSFYSRIDILVRQQKILARDWGLNISQAALTLKVMTQKLTRSATITLAQRYRANRMFNVCRIHGKMSTNTMDARCQSIHEK